jgi:hypothetical protein
MATGGRFHVGIDVREIEALASRIGEIDPEALGQAGLRAVNQVTDRVYALSRQRMNAGINLSDAYLDEAMEVRHATDPLRPRATIAARFRATTLARYDARQLVQPNKKPQSGKGDSLRGIPKGLKQAGVSVEVTRGQRKPVLGTKAFLMPLKNGNGMGVFVREGAGKKNYRHLYAPSVYQLFRTQVDALFDDIGEDLTATVRSEVELEIERALK